jgi:hypothetical protein
MKPLLLIGGLLGFGVGLLFSWVQQGPWPSSLWHACVAAYLTGMLMKWWGYEWRKNLEKAFLERQSPSEGTNALFFPKAGKS